MKDHSWTLSQMNLIEVFPTEFLVSFWGLKVPGEFTDLRPLSIEHFLFGY